MELTLPDRGKTGHHVSENNWQSCEEVVETKYYLTQQGRISDVSGGWDKCAWKDDAFEATADFVIGKYLTDFVEGFETASFLNAIFFVARRSSHPFEMLTRSDTASILRILRMRITPHTNDTVCVSHRLVLQRNYEEVGLAAKSSTPIVGVRCSMCCNQRNASVWVNPLSDRHKRYIPTGYTVCPSCKIRARSALERMNSPVNYLAEALKAKPRFDLNG